MEDKSFPKKYISQALGGMLILLSALLLLSPYGVFNALGYGFIWLLGYVGFYFLLPYSLGIGFYLLFKGKAPKLPWRFHLVAVLSFLAIGFLFGLLSYLSLDHDLNSLFPAFSSVFPRSEVAYSIVYSGGVAFTSLAGALTGVSLALPIVVLTVLFLSAIVLAVIPFVVPALRKRMLDKERKKKISESEKALQNDAYATHHEEKEEASYVDSNASCYSKPLPSRMSKNAETRFDSPITPKEIEIPNSYYRPTQEEKKISGLVEAHFEFSGKNTAYKPLTEREESFVAITKNETKASVPEPSVTHSENAAEIPNEPAINEENEVLETYRNSDKPISEINAEVEMSKASKPVEEGIFFEPERSAINETAPIRPIDEPQKEEKATETPKEDVYQEMEKAAEDLKTSEKEAKIEATEEKEEHFEGTWTAPPAKPTKEQQLDSIGMPHKKELKPYQMPPLDLLKDYPPSPDAEQEKLNCERRKNLIDEVFSNFGVGAHVEDFTIGPSVTRYNIRTDSNVSVGSLNKYIKDIAVRLNGIGIRFEEIVRGRSTSGLEVPNEKTETVSLKRMVDALPKKPGSGLYVPFGVNIDNAPIFANLADFPHLLTAGTTGSGKSVFLTGLIMSIIMRNRPEDVKLVLVDPKRVEMAKYHDLPHLLCPIIKEPSQAKVCLDKLIVEMERRYKAFEIAGVKDIGEWNNEFSPESDYAKMPYIVVFIDEYADLSDTCKNIGDAVVRIAQKARAAGIHLVIATQRPSVSVITGTIKANIGVRVALSMSSAIDSQTIIGQGGAEELVGHGDMLVDCSLISRMGFTRCQGCYCNGHEINAVCDYIRGQMEPDYNNDFMDLVDHEAEAKAAEEAIVPLSRAEVKAKSDDEFYEMVKEAVMQLEYTSISKIQRQFTVGFPRAGKIFNRLQKDGIVAAAPDTQSSSKGCRVLIHQDPNKTSEIKLAGDNE